MYSTEDQNKIAGSKLRWRLVSKIGPVGNYCEYVRKIQGNQSLSVNNPSKNGSLLPHQCSWISEKGYLPSDVDKNLTLSHIWDPARKFKDPNISCVTVSHMTEESRGENNSRKSCHRRIRKKINQSSGKRGNKTWTCDLCVDHDPPCFINTGQVIEE